MERSRAQILHEINSIFNKLQNIDSSALYQLLFAKALQFSVSERTRLTKLITLAIKTGKTKREITFLKQKRDLFNSESFKMLLSEWVLAHESDSRNPTALRAASMIFDLPEVSIDRQLELLREKLPEVEISEDDKILAKLDKQAEKELKDHCKTLNDSSKNISSSKKQNNVRSTKKDTLKLNNGYAHINTLNIPSAELPTEAYYKTIFRSCHSISILASSAFKFFGKIPSKLSEMSKKALESSNKNLIS